MDMGTAAEQLLNGTYSSFLLLAIPLFILAAEHHELGSIMDRLLRFCNAHGRPLPRRAGAGQRAAEHGVRQHVGLGAGRRRRLRQADAVHDDARTASTRRALPPRSAPCRR
jgi:hypothetical protein